MLKVGEGYPEWQQSRVKGFLIPKDKWARGLQVGKTHKTKASSSSSNLG